jgi:23S rRNA pseudouridine1911/1915/1917 synthase
MSAAEPDQSDALPDDDGDVPAGGPVDVVVSDDMAGLRVDRFLATALPALSRSRLQALVRDGAVSCDGRTISDAGLRVKPRQTYRVDVPEPQPAVPLGEPIALSIVYEDAHLVVVDKPAGLVVHPAAGHATGTLVNALIAHCGESLSGIGGVRRPGIVHRLDKDTTGLLVVAKSDVAHHGLSAQFQAHGTDGRLERRYQALVWGGPLRGQGAVDAALGRSRTTRTRMAVVNPELGRRAVTHFEVCERFAGSDGKPLATLLDLRLETGRTHQIRVHMAHVGHPVMGDPVYATGFRTSASRLPPPAAAALERLGRQALHAAVLGFEHPVTGKPMEFESPLPPDMAELLAALRPAPRKISRSRAGKPTDSGRRHR